MPYIKTALTSPSMGSGIAQLLRKNGGHHDNRK